MTSWRAIIYITQFWFEVACYLKSVALLWKHSVRTFHRECWVRMSIHLNCPFSVFINHIIPTLYRCYWETQLAQLSLSWLYAMVLLFLFMKRMCMMFKVKEERNRKWQAKWAKFVGFRVVIYFEPIINEEGKKSGYCNNTLSLSLKIWENTLNLTFHQKYTPIKAGEIAQWLIAWTVPADQSSW